MQTAFEDNKKTPLLAVAQWATVNHRRLIRHKRRRVPLIGSIIRTGEQDYTKHGLASDIIWCNQHVHLHQQKHKRLTCHLSCREQRQFTYRFSACGYITHIQCIKVIRKVCSYIHNTEEPTLFGVAFQQQQSGLSR